MCGCAESFDGAGLWSSRSAVRKSQEEKIRCEIRWFPNGSTLVLEPLGNDAFVVVPAQAKWAPGNFLTPALGGIIVASAGVTLVSAI